MNENVLVTQIQKFAVNDGPGFRTNVFLKGCPLKCRWCHNPETQSAKPELFWKQRLCIQCGECVDACPNDAVNLPIHPEEAAREDSIYQKIIRDRCDNCMLCVEACHYGALEITGQPMTIDEILTEVEQDAPFYARSGGGMTLSGGEPTSHLEFTGNLLDEALKRGLHICLDTCGFCKWEILESLSKKAHIILYDLKHLDPEKHSMMTGVDNKLILENLTKLVKSGADIWVRIVVIPGFSDTLDYHRHVVDFLSGLPGKLERIDLLPYHNWCEDKYKWLDREWLMSEYQALDPAVMIPLEELYKEKGLNVTIGGSGFENPVA